MIQDAPIFGQGYGCVCLVGTAPSEEKMAIEMVQKSCGEMRSFGKLKQAWPVMANREIPIQIDSRASQKKG